MGLRGQLEDLPLTDILQVVAFAKKTGRLAIECSFGRGGIVFREGLVVYAQSWSTLPLYRRLLSSSTAHLEETWVRQQIELSLHELTRLREGSFDFELTASVVNRLENMDISRLVLPQGVNPQRLLLDLAKERDEDRRDTTDMLQSAAQLLIPEPGSENRRRGERDHPAVLSKDVDTADPARGVESARPSTIVLVDDEHVVAEVMGQEFREAGYEVVTASAPAEAAKLVRRWSRSGQVLVVTDLRMPTSSGGSFWGGFELLRRLKRMSVRASVVLMAESLSGKARARARELGIRRVAFKPALSKLDEQQYRADLKSFAKTLLEGFHEAPPLEIAERKKDAEEARESQEDGKLLLEFLNMMTAHLVSPHRSTDISRMVLQVAQEYLERGIWFLVRKDQVTGLAGFGLGPTEKDSFEVAKKLHFGADDVEVFREVLHLRKPRRFGPESDGLEARLYPLVGASRSSGSVVVPMLSNGEVVAVLYGDNGKSGAPIPSLRGLELFVAHAGIAMENVFLNRKLRSFEAKLSSVEGGLEEPASRG